MKLIFLFIDGFGIGDDDPGKNPFCTAEMPNYRALADRYGIHAADATLGVCNIPQSATGQTTIYTGVNASKLIGRHHPARPTRELADLLMKDNIFISLKRRGLSVTFANVYTDEYLQQMRDRPRGIFKPSVTTLLCLSSDTPFRTLNEYGRGCGVFHDITGARLAERGYDIALITPEQAAENLYRVSRENDLTLFEFFMTDIAGHAQDMAAAVKLLEQLDAFIGRLVALTDLDEDVLLIASDHGNIEDISVKSHTCNPVPVIIAGERAISDTIEISDLTDIKPAVMKLFEKRFLRGENR